MSANAKKYETVLILRPDLTEEATKKVLERITEMVSRSKASIKGIRDLGKKQLAYPIAKHSKGHYFEIRYEGQGQTVDDLEHHLKLSEDAVRFLTVKIEKDFVTPPEFKERSEHRDYKDYHKKEERAI